MWQKDKKKIELLNCLICAYVIKCVFLVEFFRFIHLFLCDILCDEYEQ